MDIDLVLSGSGVKFPAFIGGLKALEENNIIPKRVAGTSGGALVAVGIACGLKSDDLKKIILEQDFSSFKDFSLFSLLFRYGLYKGNKLEKFLDTITSGKTFSDLTMDCRIIGANITQNTQIVFSKDTHPNMKLSTALRYSLSIPFVFGYKKLNKDIIIDGMFSSNYDLDIFDNKNTTIGFIIGGTSTINHLVLFPFGLFQYLYLLFFCLISSLEQKHISDAFWAKSIFIDIAFDSLNFNINQKIKEDMFDIGYKTVSKNIEKTTEGEA